MSQIGRELSCNKIWTRAEKIKAGIVSSAPSMAQNSEESRLYYGQRVAGSGAVAGGGEHAEASHRAEGRASSRLARDLDKQCCHTSGAPQADLFHSGSRVGDARSFSACATISETARELCKAVSVSLGLTMESVDTGDPDASLPPPCSRGECLLGGEAPSGDAAPAAAAGAYNKCPSERDERPVSGHEQLVDMFRSSGGRLQDFGHARTSAGEQSFALCEAQDAAAEERDRLDGAARTECCTYGQSAAGAPAAERPCRLYKLSADDARDFGEESKFSGYLAEPYSVRIKSEEPSCSRSLWANSYAFHDTCNNSQLWASRQCAEPRSAAAAASGAMCTTNPYERNVMRPEQWYGGGMLRPPYPNSNYSTYLKAEVGEWLDVAYTDNR